MVPADTLRGKPGPQRYGNQRPISARIRAVREPDEPAMEAILFFPSWPVTF